MCLICLDRLLWDVCTSSVRTYPFINLSKVISSHVIFVSFFVYHLGLLCVAYMYNSSIVSTEQKLNTEYKKKKNLVSQCVTFLLVRPTSADWCAHILYHVPKGVDGPGRSRLSLLCSNAGHFFFFFFSKR